MPRPLIDARQQAAGLARHRGAARQATGGGKILMQPRSRRYVEAIKALDARTSMGPVDTESIADDLRREFDEKWARPPLGYVAHCYLGVPFEVHTLTDSGDIIEHYRSGQSLPAELEKARPLATERYLCIEVYADRLVAVLPDGSVALMEGQK